MASRTLPADTHLRLLAIVDRSRPKDHPLPPGVTDEEAEKIRKVDKKNAECYASMEDLSARFCEVADEIMRDCERERVNGIVQSYMDESIDTGVVEVIEDTRQTLEMPADELAAIVGE